MAALLGLLLVLAGVSHGMETSCNATQDGAWCYGALGGTVYLQLMTDARGLEFRVFKYPGRTVILNMKFNTSVPVGPSKDRSEFYTNNGTLKIRNTTREDSAEYRVDIHDPATGHISKNTSLQLSIEAPVSSPLLSPKCLSQGEVRVSCSSEGDGPRYSWTVPGTAVVLSGGDNSTVTLKRGSSGELICTAKNHVSSAAGHLNISPCPGLLYINCTSPNGTQISDWVNATGNTLCLEPTTVAPATPTTTPPTKGRGTTAVATSRPSNHTTASNNSTRWNLNHTIIVTASLSAAVVFLLAALGVYYARKKRKKSASAPDDAEDVTYADVSFAKEGRERRTKKKPAEEVVEYGQVKASGACRLQPSQATPPEVEYGQVTILPGSRRTAHPKPQEDCVYSSVRRGQ